MIFFFFTWRWGPTPAPDTARLRLAALITRPLLLAEQPVRAAAPACHRSASARGAVSRRGLLSLPCGSLPFCYPVRAEAVMKCSFATVLIAALAFPTATHAQGKPDFSGTWTMDQTRSESAVQSDPIGPVTVVIAQTPTELRVETTRKQGTSVITYKLDGSEIKIPGGTAKTHWDGSTLVVEAVRDVQGQTVTTKETRRLSGDGNEMLVETMLVVQHGYSLRGTPNYGAGKDIFVRSR